MSFSLRSLAALAASALVSVTVWAAEPAPGFVDFGSFAGAEGHDFVDIEIDGSLLKLAAVFADKKDEELGKLVANLDRVRVNVFGLADETRDAAMSRIASIRSGLADQGWKRVVTVKEKKGDDVAVFLKQAADDSIQGVVVTVISSDNEAVLVNVVGNVQLEQIAKLGERLDVEPLRQLDLAVAH